MDWNVKPRNLFRVFIPTEDDLSQLRGYVLIEVGSDGVPEDVMRLAVHGDDPLKVHFTGRDVFSNPQLQDYTFTYPILPASIQIRDNMATSDWMDIREGIMKRDIEVHEEEDASLETFVKTLDVLREADYRVGAVLRWTIQASTPSQLILVLQTLPVSVAHIRTKAMFKMDNCPAISLATFELGCKFQ